MVAGWPRVRRCFLSSRLWRVVECRCVNWDVARSSGFVCAYRCVCGMMRVVGKVRPRPAMGALSRLEG